MRTLNLPWLSVRPGRRISLALLVASTLLVACGVDPPNDKQVCTTNQDCPSGKYCDEREGCIQDCEPGTGRAECAGEKSCSDDGRCVRVTCERDADCPERMHCGEGTCQQDCNPTASSPCAAGERCTDRGRCERAGACTEDRDCEDPPAPTCSGDEARRPASDGTCDTSVEPTVCQYPVETQTCSYGCENGACLPNPCEGRSCDTPPPAECSADGTELVTYLTPGTCQADQGGECTYQKMRSSCANGCSNGSCAPAECQTVTCDDPPSDACDGNVAVRYEQRGMCVDTMNGGTQCKYDPTFEHCSYTGATCEDSGTSVQCTGAVAQVGGVVVTEVMADPAARVDRAGEWFEIQNVSTSSIDLRSWQIRSEGDGSHAIGASLTAAPGERLVLARDDDPAGDGSVTPDYVYDDIGLANGGDWIRIEKPNGAIADHVFWEAGSLLEGRSRKLDPSVTATAAANDDYSNWCPSLETGESLSNGEEWGSPGTPNQSCASQPCSKVVCERPEGFCKDGDGIRPTEENASCSKSRFNNPNCDYGVEKFNCTSNELCAKGFCEAIPSDVPAKGELIITEMMGNPDAVSDTNGEWIEVYNTTSTKLSLFSVILEDTESGRAKDSHTFLTEGLDIPAESYAVFAVETDASKNGGVQNAIHYKGSHLKNSPANLKIQLVRQDRTVIDKAYYRAPEAGVAQQLSLSAYEQGATDPDSANDDASNWCDADRSYGDGDLGTPGAANRRCP